MRTLAAVLLLVSTVVSAQAIYRWTDKKGEVHYTDDLSAVPKGAKLETTEGEELMIEPPRPAAPKPIAEVKPTFTGKQQQPQKQSGPVEVRLKQVNVQITDVDRQYIEDSLRTAAASPRLVNWGGLRESVEVEIAPGEKMRACGAEAFGLAIGRNQVMLRAPKDTLSNGFVLDYAGTALHELAHILEHQTAGQARPRWFAEGFACFVAEQVRGAAIDDIAWWVIHEGGPRPLDLMFGAKPCNVHLAYAIAKEAVRYLVELVGESGVQKMFDLRANGSTFEAAFTSAAGFTVEEFQARFATSLKPNYYERAR